MSNLTIEKHSANLTETFDLAKALSYSKQTCKLPNTGVTMPVFPSLGPPNGLAPIGKFVYNFVRDIYKPSYADWGTLVNLGSGDALTKVTTAVTCLKKRNLTRCTLRLLTSCQSLVMAASWMNGPIMALSSK